MVAFDSNIEYLRSDKNTTDALSRLPVGEEKYKGEEITYFNCVLNFLAISKKILQVETSRDADLMKLFLFTPSVRLASRL